MYENDYKINSRYLKMKRFLFITLILCAFQVPARAFIEENELISQSAAGGLAEELFTFDPKLASVKLEFVDFKIDRNRTPAEWGKDIGRYNFKLFGCRRMEKKIVLNQGRAMRRDMKFGDVFFEEMNEIFPVVVNKTSRYFPYSIGDRVPGYLITAEIKDLYVNVCDHYDWRTRKYSQLRSGSAEIKVLWRVMTPFNRKLYWEDTTYGYATIEDPIRDGEIRLVEKAFADALNRMTGMPGFMETVRRIPDPSEIERARKNFEAMAYAHVQNRRNLMSSYRRRRMTFYNEREKQKVLGRLEKIVPADMALSSTDLGRENALKGLSRDELERLASYKAGNADALTPEEAARFAALENLDKLTPGEYGSGIFGKLLTSTPLRQGFFGKLLTSTPLIRLFDGYTLSSSLLDSGLNGALLNADLVQLAEKYGFTVSDEDGTITIANQKPFRYLSPTRIYRIRSSLVAVTNDKNIGSGLVIAPALILTNYSITKMSPYINVEFLDGRVLPAMVLRADKDRDVALLYIPPTKFDEYNWPIPLRLDLPDVGERFYAIGTPMRGGFEGALEAGKVAGYRYTDSGVEILTNTNVQSVTLGGIMVDENGNAAGIAHSGESLIETRDGFIPIGDAFDALKIRILDRDMDETPTQKARRLRKERENFIK